MMTHSVRDRIWRYAPLFLWILFIYIASTTGFSAANTSRFIRPLLLWLFPEISEERLMLVHFFIRKAAHFMEYAVLGFLAARAFSSSSKRLLREYWFFAGAFLIVSYALLDEFHQSFVHARTASLSDTAIDIAGGLFALMCRRISNVAGGGLKAP